MPLGNAVGVMPHRTPAVVNRIDMTRNLPALANKGNNTEAGTDRTDAGAGVPDGCVCCDKCKGIGYVAKPAQLRVNILGGMVDLVIRHYQVHHPRYRGDKKGRAKVRARLDDGFSVDELCKAIDGNHLSPWHCGENDTGQKFNSLCLIMRDADKVNGFMEMADNPPQAVTQKTRFNNRAAQAFIEGGG